MYNDVHKWYLFTFARSWKWYRNIIASLWIWHWGINWDQIWFCSTSNLTYKNIYCDIRQMFCSIDLLHQNFRRNLKKMLLRVIIYSKIMIRWKYSYHSSFWILKDLITWMTSSIESPNPFCFLFPLFYLHITRLKADFYMASTYPALTASPTLILKSHVKYFISIKIYIFYEI